MTAEPLDILLTFARLGLVSFGGANLPEIERVLARDAAPQATCEALVSAANRAGGEDNITVVMVRFA